MRIDPLRNSKNCPKCGAENQQGDSCFRCGIVFHKYTGRAGSDSSLRKLQIRQPEKSFPYKAFTRLSQLTLLISLLLLVLSNHRQAILPQADFYAGAVLSDPIQTDTSVEPFEIVSNDIVYTINPLHDYQLHGVVVSFHDSDSWWDIYHRRSWQDFINVKDICVIWGDNVTSGVYQKMAFKNSTWTCWASWPDRETGSHFSMHQLSNNHLLVSDPHIREIADRIEIGDQIRLEGLLASYSHSNGKFTRGTSTSRTDTGNGACETVYVNELEIVGKANPGWHWINLLARWLVAVSFVCATVLVIKSPVRISN